MLNRASRLSLLALSLLVLSPMPVWASGPHALGIGQEGARVPEPGLSELSVGSRFASLQRPAGLPDLGLRLGIWPGGGLGMSYSSNGQTPGNPHEVEFLLKQQLLSEAHGAPFSASFMGAVNTGAYSIDGELALSRTLGPLTLAGTARLLGNADGARLPFGGVGVGARLVVAPPIALVGDVFQVVNQPGVLPAWGAGMQVQVPSSPWAVTLLMANTSSLTRQGASVGTSALRVGVDLALALPSWPAASLASEPPEPPRQLFPSGGASHAIMPSDPAQATRQPASASISHPAEPAKGASTPAPMNQPPASETSVSPTPSVRPARRPQPPVEKRKPRTVATEPKAQGETKRPEKRTATPKATARAVHPRTHELWIVMIRSGTPSPAQVAMTRGSSVTWFNRDASAHTLSITGGKAAHLPAGQQLTRRFEQPGTFRYQCLLHPGEGGTVSVR